MSVETDRVRSRDPGKVGIQPSRALGSLPPRPTPWLGDGLIDDAVVAPRDRCLLLARRQAIIIELGAIEDYLGLERSIIPRRKRVRLE